MYVGRFCRKVGQRYVVLDRGPLEFLDSGRKHLRVVLDGDSGVAEEPLRI